MKCLKKINNMKRIDLVLGSQVLKPLENYKLDTLLVFLNGVLQQPLYDYVCMYDGEVLFPRKTTEDVGQSVTLLYQTT